MGYNSWIVDNSENYMLKADNWGNYTLIRHSDGKSLFFQGGDALEIESEVENTRFNLEVWASEYDACIETWED